MVVPEGLLERMQLVLGRKALDRGEGDPVSLHREHGARFDGLPVHVDRAGAAVGCVAAHVRAGQPKLIADRVDQQ